MPELVFRTRPHGEHVFRLYEDHEKFDNRIYELVDHKGQKIGLLGSELDSLLGWWLIERQRPGTTPTET